MEGINKFKDSIKPVGIDGTKIIMNQLMNCIYKIKINGRFETGFFCKIPFRKEAMKALMINYHVLNEKYLKENKILNLTLNNDKENLIIDLRIAREIYFNKAFDMTLIELKEKEKINEYLELDDNLFLDNAKRKYKDKSIYILHYPEGKEAKVSYGKLLDNIGQFNIIHNCITDIGSTGAPIINLTSNKLIGIHYKNTNNYNVGTLLEFPLKNLIIKKEKQKTNINKKDYKIIKELGKGGFGRVYQVLRKSDNKYYAIKVIPIKDETNEKIKNFENEAEILSKFNCDNIVKYYGSSKDNNNIYILMEYCESDNLRSFINKYMNNNMLIEENILCNIIKQICMGIKIIHNKKIVHRDLKPENIFINGKINIKIGDFGISKQLDLYKSYALSKSKLGTDYYISPELLDIGIYNEKTDIYSLGCIIYELFNLSIYFNDKLSKEIKTINTNIYNNKWQILIDSLLQSDYNKRFDINQVIHFLENELNIKDNKIIGEINIKKMVVGKYIRIINSFENAKREGKWKDLYDDWKYENEKEIKGGVEIKVNGKIFEFSYYYKFIREGKYIIEYTFENNLTKTCYMFDGCDLLTNLDLSNFNTHNVTNMSCMFCNCKSLTNLNLSNFNTQNVTDMRSMFNNCISLTNLDLSNFNIQNVTDMSWMFYSCNSLANLDLSNFNTQNVTDMSYMFSFCGSLTYLNLSNFNTQEDTEISDMFLGCDSLKKEKINTKDNKILKSFK